MSANQWFDDFCGHQFWDNQLTWNTTQPQLTLCFRQTILIWIPSAFLWLFSPLELIFIARSRGRAIPWNIQNMSRVLAVALICLINLMDSMFCIYLTVQYDRPVSVPQISAQFINCITFTLLEILIIFHRRKGMHTSGVVWIFSLLALVCGFPTVYQNSFLSSPKYLYELLSYLLYYSLVIIVFLISCFADLSPKHIPKTTEWTELSEKLVNEDIKGFQQKNPEIEASFLSKLIFWWINDFVITGYKKSLTTSDLWCLKDEDKTESIASQFDKNWLKQINDKKYQNVNQNHVLFNNNNETEFNTNPTKHMKRPGIVIILMKTFGAQFLLVSVFLLLYYLLEFVTPFILKEIIGFVSKPSWVEPEWHGFYFALLLFIIGCLQSLFYNYYISIRPIIGRRVQTALTSAIYKKSLHLSNSTRKEITTGKIVNLMSIDAQRMSEAVGYINDLWSVPLHIILALFLLWRELGPSVLAGLVVIILTLPLNALVVGYQRKLQIKQKDERVKAMNEILNGIRVIKLFSWEKSFMTNVSDIRDIELINLKYIEYFTCASTFIWTSAPIILSLTTFAVYVLSDPNHILDAQKAFVSLHLFHLLSYPMTLIPQMVTIFAMTAVSIKRLNKFFNSSQLEEYVNREEERDAIVIENGTFSWNSNEELSQTEFTKENTLSEININIEKGSLVAVVGSVGSGKSSLIYAILGEMDRLVGRVNISGSSKIAYVPQQAWIQNSSLKQNILFGMRFNKQKYNEIINCCALRSDLSELPAGDETEIGEKGINLSGGQRQRVSIARACYSDADIVLMDDPLSSVDAEVAKHIFRRVLSNKKGYLRQKTVIFVTNSLNFLPKVNQIVVIKKGRIHETGNYDQLMESKGHFCEFIEEFSVKHKETNEPDIQRQVSFSEEKDRSMSDQKYTEKSKLIETESTETGKVKTSVYIRYFRSFTWFWLSLTLFGVIGKEAMGVGATIWLAIWSNDRPIDGTQDKDGRNTRLCIFGLFGLLEILFVVMANISRTRGTLMASRTLHNSLLKRILRSPMSFFDTTPIGRVVNRFSADIDAVDSIIATFVAEWLICLCELLSAVLVICAETPMFLLFILPIAFFYYFIQRFYVSTSRQLKRLDSVSRSPIYSHFNETLSGVSTIRAYNSKQRFISELNCKVDLNNACFYPRLIASRWLSIRLDLMASVIVFLTSVLAVLSRHSFYANPGFVGLIITYALSMTITLNEMVRNTSEIETNIVSVERITEYCDNPTEAEWDSQPIHRPPTDWPNCGRIEFIDYSVRYRPGLELVIRDINAAIKPSEKIGIVGRTGAGKSSLSLALFRLLEASNGKIVIDGLDISRIGLHDLRSRLTVIPQDPVLFSGTVRSNLDPFKSYTDDQIWTALEHSYLKQHIIGLDSELDHKVTEGGDNLSLGQRQLICLARALLRGTKILVLDEATAAVDLETDSLIQKTIRKEFKDCTVLTIAHRLNTIMDSNRVLVLARGQLVEFDTPENLLKNPNSMFHNMAKEAQIF